MGTLVGWGHLWDGDTCGMGTLVGCGRELASHERPLTTIMFTSIAPGIPCTYAYVCQYTHVHVAMHTYITCSYVIFIAHLAGIKTRSPAQCVINIL